MTQGAESCKRLPPVSSPLASAGSPSDPVTDTVFCFPSPLPASPGACLRVIQSASPLRITPEPLVSLAKCPASPLLDRQPSIPVHGAFKARFRSSLKMYQLHVYLSSGSAAFNFLFCLGAAVVSVMQMCGHNSLTSPCASCSLSPSHPSHVSLLPRSLQIS